MQSGAPTKVWFNLSGGAMQSKCGERLVGVDVSKAWIDICPSGTTRVERVANTPEALAAWIARDRPTLVAMEPTGGYERALCWALAEAGVRYVKLHPNKILAFRKARGLRAKTDRIDAALIAQSLALGQSPSGFAVRLSRRRAPAGASGPTQAARPGPSGRTMPRGLGERCAHSREPGSRHRRAQPKS
jgi:hypothetical protein